MFSFDPVGSYEREIYRAAGSASSLLQPLLDNQVSFLQARIFWGGGGVHPPEMICTAPANYIYFDLIVSYLIILTTKFVKLPILWSQILPCRPRK